MNNMIKQISLTLSYLLSVTFRSPYGRFLELLIQEITRVFLSLGFLIALAWFSLIKSFYQYFQLCRIFNSRKQKNYINFKSFTYKKLNCLTVLPCKTIYSIQISKNCLRLYHLIKHFFCKTFNYFKNL
ncbi:hypothetical protein LCGC14_1953140, partial [marine sediment metagenome]